MTFEQWRTEAEQILGFPLRTERARNAWRIGVLTPSQFARTMTGPPRLPAYFGTGEGEAA